VKIGSIELRNFRQFVGKQTFVFKSDSLRPVSLIFGGNGAGKTTLLNAFTWALYGSMSGTSKSNIEWLRTAFGAT
jgi:DNA sulfur modification protein DndD